jgi:hypothetical protein
MPAGRPWDEHARSAHRPQPLHGSPLGGRGGLSNATERVSPLTSRTAVTQAGVQGARVVVVIAGVSWHRKDFALAKRTIGNRSLEEERAELRRERAPRARGTGHGAPSWTREHTSVCSMAAHVPNPLSVVAFGGIFSAMAPVEQPRRRASRGCADKRWPKRASSSSCSRFSCRDRRRVGVHAHQHDRALARTAPVRRDARQCHRLDLPYATTGCFTGSGAAQIRTRA